MKTLETKRTLLREWKTTDANDIFKYASTPKIGPMAGWKPHESIDESKTIIEMFIRENETWAIELKETGHVIGSVGLHHSKKKGLEYDLELGYVLSEEYWGKGIVPEAAKAAIDYAFTELGISKLIVSHFTFNTQSKRVIEKCGFKYLTHIDSSWVRYDSAVLDEEVYYMTRDDFFGIKN